MPADLQERTPGVYVRADHELPHELDMLWANPRALHREERSPVVTFAAGLVLGVLLTSAVFLLVINQPKISTNVSQLMAPITDGTESAAPAKPGNQSASGSTAHSTGAMRNARTYTVKQGDTLGGIAYRMYGSSAPDYVEKLQRANNMDSPDQIRVDQKLIIPPKTY